MWMSRFLLHRIAEIFNVEVTFDPKPIPGRLVCLFPPLSPPPSFVSFCL
jgi:hypothetical protein